MCYVLGIKFPSFGGVDSTKEKTGWLNSPPLEGCPKDGVVKNI